MRIEEYVSTYDPTEQFIVLKDSWKQIEYALNLKIRIQKPDYSNIIVSGMGGSAISADLAKNFLINELRVPFIVNRNYTLPNFAGEDTLLIISSYSGNTEETLSVLEQGLKKKCRIICITTGGKVKDIARGSNLPLVILEPGMQPRYSLGQSFFALLSVLEEVKAIPLQKNVAEEIMHLWKKLGEDYSADDNYALKLASELIGFTPVIYSAADKTDALGYRFKCQFNENSKVLAFHNVIPEMNHNEIIGWESFLQKESRIKVINILDKEYPEQIKKRFSITSSLITAKETEIINLESSHNNFKIRLFDLIYLADWITYYLAVLRGYDPVEIEYINILKNRLS